MRYILIDIFIFKISIDYYHLILPYSTNMDFGVVSSKIKRKKLYLIKIMLVYGIGTFTLYIC